MRCIIYTILLILATAPSLAVSAYAAPDDPTNKGPRYIKGPLKKNINPFARISGRVLTTDGVGIRNTMIFLSGEDGIRYSLSGSFGFFSINDVPTGKNYALNVAHPRFIFAYPAEIIKIHGDITDLLVIGEVNMAVGRQ